jgi:hypothetical protein
MSLNDFDLVLMHETNENQNVNNHVFDVIKKVYFLVYKLLLNIEYLPFFFKEIFLHSFFAIILNLLVLGFYFFGLKNAAGSFALFSIIMTIFFIFLIFLHDSNQSKKIKKQQQTTTIQNNNKKNEQNQLLDKDRIVNENFIVYTNKKTEKKNKNKIFQSIKYEIQKRFLPLLDMQTFDENFLKKKKSKNKNLNCT